VVKVFNRRCGAETQVGDGVVDLGLSLDVKGLNVEVGGSKLSWRGSAALTELIQIN